MLKKAKKTLLPLKLTVEGQGEKVVLDLVYRNIKQSEFTAMLDKVGGEPVEGQAETTMADVVVAVVESWDNEYELTVAGVTEMEDDRPGMIFAITQGFHAARQVAKVKN